jgi:uncharacterized protein
MRYVHRELEPQVLKAARSLPAVVLTGPRRAGQNLLLRPPDAESGLLGIDTAAELAKSPFRGAIFEGFIGSEIVKAPVNRARRRELYYFRDEQGLEVDFLVPGRNGAIRLVECKATGTVTPIMTAPMLRLAEAIRRKRQSKAAIEMFLVHQPSKGREAEEVVALGVRALGWPRFLAAM